MEEEFDQVKSQLITDLANSTSSMELESQFYWARICQFTYDFTHYVKLAENISRLALADFVNYYSAVFFSNKVKRLDYHLVSAAHQGEADLDVDTPINKDKLMIESTEVSRVFEGRKAL